MYKIVENGEIVDLIDEPRYIRLKEETGAFIQTDEEHAQGIAVRNDPFNLAGHIEIFRVIVTDEGIERIPAPVVDVSVYDPEHDGDFDHYEISDEEALNIMLGGEE